MEFYVVFTERRTFGHTIIADDITEAQREFQRLYNSDDPTWWADHTLENTVLESEVMEVPDELLPSKVYPGH